MTTQQTQRTHPSSVPLRIMDPPTLSPPLRLKPALQSIPDAAPDAPLIFLLHPGYSDNHNILLTLPAFDSGGIHHETARIACAILANSRWDGYLSLSREGKRLLEGPDEVLVLPRYYFIVEGEEKYPIVPTFDHFICPSSLPASYEAAPIALSSCDDAIRRDVTCRITGSALAYETAHVIPAAQGEWWRRNTMFRYMSNPDPGVNTRCANNTILLRRDLHKLWDDNKFAFVPKADQWIIHGLWNSSEIQEAYHNRLIQPLSGVSPYFFLCRFALAIFSRSPFLNQGVPRELIVVDVEDPSKQKILKMPIAEIQKNFATTNSRGTSRSQSPKKRQKSATEDGAEDESAEEFGSEEDSDLENDNEEEVRGRALKRKWSPELEYNLISQQGYRRQPLKNEENVWESRSPFRKRPRSSSSGRRPHTPPRSTSPAR